MQHEVFEKIVMHKLLDNNDELFNSFKLQYANAQIIDREFTGCGFFTKFSIPASLSRYKVSGRIDDVMATFDNHYEYYFILYVTDGLIDTLEGFASVGDWEYDYENATIKHCFADRRDFNLE